MASYDNILKIIIVGEAGVGKSCLLLRYVDNKFITNHYSTIGVDYKEKSININGNQALLQIWDTAGQERFRSIAQYYFKGAQGALVVFDVSDKTTLDKVKYWIDSVKEKDNQINLILIGNKTDLNRNVSTEDGKKLAEQFDIHYYETSALNGSNVREVFQDISGQILNRIANAKNIKNTVTITEKKEKSKCNC